MLRWGVWSEGGGEGGSTTTSQPALKPGSALPPWNRQASANFMHSLWLHQDWLHTTSRRSQTDWTVFFIFRSLWSISPGGMFFKILSFFSTQTKIIVVDPEKSKRKHWQQRSVRTNATMTFVFHYSWWEGCTHGTRTCIKRKKIIHGKFLDFCAEKCI